MARIITYIKGMGLCGFGILLFGNLLDYTDNIIFLVLGLAGLGFFMALGFSEVIMENVRNKTSENIGHRKK